MILQFSKTFLKYSLLLVFIISFLNISFTSLAKNIKPSKSSNTLQKVLSKNNNKSSLSETNKNDLFSIKFYGVRGSYPKPSANNVKFGGNSSCVEVLAGGHTIIIDAGTGIINLGDDLLKEYLASGTNNQNRKPLSLVMLFSHNHLDHIMGFPFFKPAYIAGTKLFMFGEKSGNLNFNEILANSMSTPYFPVALNETAALKEINNFDENEIILLYPDKPEPEVKKVIDLKDKIPEDVVKITSMKSYAHPKDGVLLFKIEWKSKSVVYASDKESYPGGDVKLINFAKNADILIHDTQYTPEDYLEPFAPKQGYGHSTPEMAIEIAKNAHVQKLIMFHHDPNYSDEKIDQHEKNAQKQFPQTIAAKEGMVIQLLP